MELATLGNSSSVSEKEVLQELIEISKKPHKPILILDLNAERPPEFTSQGRFVLDAYGEGVIDGQPFGRRGSFQILRPDFVVYRAPRSRRIVAYDGGQYLCYEYTAAGWFRCFPYDGRKSFRWTYSCLFGSLAAVSLAALPWVSQEYEDMFVLAGALAFLFIYATFIAFKVERTTPQ